MDYSELIKSIDDLASDLVFLEKREIDIPSSGKFMNRLEEIIKTAEPLQIAQLTHVATGLNHILEKMVFDTLKDKEQGFSLFEKGIALMQEMIHDYQQGVEYNGNVQPFLETVASVTGVPVPGETNPVEIAQEQDAPASRKNSNL